jgi:hypothetical protein
MKKEAFFDKAAVLQYEQQNRRYKNAFIPDCDQIIKSMRNFAADV